MKIWLDVRQMEERKAAHVYLKERLELPDYYGGNLDALHDCLTEFSDVELVLCGAEEAQGYYPRLERVLLEAARENEGLLVQREKRLIEKERKEFGEAGEAEEKFWEEIVRECGLGLLAGTPKRVTGGYQHKMYRLETLSEAETSSRAEGSLGANVPSKTNARKEVYAVKLLNSMIMRRPDAIENYRRAERLERVLEEQGIPLVPALERNGRRMQQTTNGQYYYVFPWIEGKADGWQDITVEHCQAAGRILARIHTIDLKREAEKESKMEAQTEDWESYIALAEKSSPKLAVALKQSQPLLLRAREEYNAAKRRLPAVTSICDGDMDSKNVLWQDGKPMLIDLECLDYGNPFWEAFQLALSWAGSMVCELDYLRLKAFLTAYEEEGGERLSDCFPGGVIDWRELYGAGFSWLEWLEYNVKRALKIECQDEEEQKLGVSEAMETLKRMEYYAAVRGELLEELL